MIACRPRGSGRRWVARVLAATGLGLLAMGFPAGGPAAHAQPFPAQNDQGYVDTEWGPLGPGDRDLLVRVKYAGLWEIPAGQMAAERGTDPRVREIGADISEEHKELDQLAEEAAEQLGVPLPDKPMAQHQAYLNRMEDGFGGGFDDVFVQLLREQHGLVYPIIAYARAGTENELIREFASTSEVFIQRHMDYLESTGKVDWSKIEPAAEPLGAQSRFLGTQPAGIQPVFIWIILGAAAVAGAITVVRTIRPR